MNNGLKIHITLGFKLCQSDWVLVVAASKYFHKLSSVTLMRQIPPTSFDHHALQAKESLQALGAPT